MVQQSTRDLCLVMKVGRLISSCGDRAGAGLIEHTASRMRESVHGGEPLAKPHVVRGSSASSMQLALSGMEDPRQKQFSLLFALYDSSPLEEQEASAVGKATASCNLFLQYSTFYAMLFLYSRESSI